MLRLFCILSCLLSSTCSDALSDSRCRINPPFRQHKVITLRVSTQAGLDRITKILTTYCEIKSLTDDVLRLHQQALLIITPEQFEALRSTSIDRRGNHYYYQDNLPPIIVISYDLEATLAAAPKQHSGYRRKVFATTRRGSSVLRLDQNFYSHFSTFEDLVNKWSDLTQLYSPYVTQEVLGRSYEGRDIIALRIGNTDPDNPRRIFLNGLQHAREWIASHVPTYIAESLAVSAATGDDEFASLLKNVEVIIAPLVNPDGYIYSHTSYRLQRKNRRLAGCSTRRQDGVDLNRNWGKNFSGGDSPGINPCSETFFGSEAFSEPETKAIRKFFLETSGIQAHLDFHSFGRLVLSPWSYTEESQDEPPRDEENCGLGVAVAEAMTQSYGLPYSFGKGTSLYVVGGTMTDWVADQGILSHTIELRPRINAESSGFLGHQGFLLAEEEILPTCKEGLEAVKTLLRFAADPSSFSRQCSQSESSILPNPGDDGGDRTGKSSSPLDLAFVLGISLGGVAFVVLVAMIIIVVRRARRNPPSLEDAEASDVASEYAESAVSGDEQLARISVDSQQSDPKR